MTFSEKFGNFVCVGDPLTCEVDGFTVTARIAHDDTPDAPDQRQDGFWPSLYPNDAGFIGAGNGWRDRFATAQAKAEAVMEAWKNDEWFYCGVILSAAIDGLELTDHAASLWGIEANYPDRDNAYLAEVANELVSEAIEAAKAERKHLSEMARSFPRKLSRRAFQSSQSRRRTQRLCTAIRSVSMSTDFTGQKTSMQQEPHNETVIK